tara:strand:+ start:7088 stop:8623 length:1536 start_codon:yes stop_codon:yes gene_type:complete
MNWNKLNPLKWFAKADKPEPEAVEKDGDTDGEFSTDFSAYRKNSLQAQRQAAINKTFAKTAKDVNVFSAPGVAMDSVAMDGSVNKSAYTINSGSMSLSLYSWYASQSFIGYTTCAVIAQNGLVSKACFVPARDAIKKGYKITANSGEDIDSEIITALTDRDKHFKINKNLVEFAGFNRVFGIRVALFRVESSDKKYYEKPFNIDGVTKGSYKGISQIDPSWMTPELSSESLMDPAHPDFYEPSWWNIGGKRYHKSHLCIILHDEVADIMKPSYNYGGISIPQIIYERVYAAERTANEAPLLALTKRMNVIKTDIGKALANQEAFEDRLSVANNFRDNFGILAIDKDEEWQQAETTLSDLDAAIMTQYQIVAGLSNVPATKLLGTSPKGFSATGEFEESTYYDLLETIQTDQYEPLLDRHYALLIKSEIAPKHNIEPFEFKLTWEPLKSMTPKEKAEVGEINSRTDGQLVQAGSIDAAEARDRLISDPNSGYNGLESYDTEYEDDTDDDETI